jgi:two-component system, NtrC family, sensor histidine kinase HydH
MSENTGRSGERTGGFPTSAFIAIVAVVCIALAISAGYDFIRLQSLRTEYLRNIAAGVAADIENQMRGPGARLNPNLWRNLFADSLGARGSDVAFLALLDETDQVLASEGDRFAPVFAGSSGYVRAQGTALYLFDKTVSLPRAGLGGGMGPGAGMGPGMGPGPGAGMGGGMGPGTGRRAAPSKLRVGIYTSSADFIRWRAYTHLAINGIAIFTLIILARFFLRTLRRFVQLKEREESARHLTALGTMAATLAHEIRNPLGAMKGLTQLAQEDLPGEHKTQSLMNTVVREAERLEQLVTDLLTFARPRDPQISRFDYGKMLHDVKAGLQPKLDAAGIRLEISLEPENLSIDSDENGIRQILLNILLNAMDTTPQGGAIAVRARCDDKAQALITEVDDSGPGFGGRNPEELFEPFATTKTKGTGLGLPISRQIAERLSGTLVLSGRPEGGARCTLRLPLRLPA